MWLKLDPLPGCHTGHAGFCGTHYQVAGHRTVLPAIKVHFGRDEDVEGAKNLVGTKTGNHEPAKCVWRAPLEL